MRTSNLQRLPILFLAVSLAFAGCKKNEEETPAPAPPPANNNTTPTANAQPAFPGADGSLWAVRSFVSQTTPIGTFDMEVGMGVAAFSDDDYATMLNVGGVTLNGTALVRNSNNAYVSQPSQAQPQGIDNLTSDVTWVVDGGNGIPGFTRSINSFPLPTVGTIMSEATVVRSDGYTVFTNQVSGADSIMFFVGHIGKTLGSGATMCSFTADELSTLSTGSNIVQIAAYKYTNESIGGKMIYFGKETVKTKSVTIQ